MTTTAATPTALDSISISDRMSSSSSMFAPSPPLKTTTISTIAVDCLGSRMVIALLQSRDVLNLRVLEMTPSLACLGSDVEESERFLNDHKNMLERLRSTTTPVEEYFRKTCNSPTPELSAAMGDNLGQAWRDLLSNLELRKEILTLGISFHRRRLDCIDSFQIEDESGFMQKYNRSVEAGRKLLEKLETVEESTESVVRVKCWMEDLTKRLEDLQNSVKQHEESKRLNCIYDALEKELNEIISSENMESKTQKLLALLAKVGSSPIPLPKKSYLEKRIYTLMEEIAKKTGPLAELKEFLSKINKLDSFNFKEMYMQKLKIAKNFDLEITTTIQRRLQIREEYEEILQNVLGYSEQEVFCKLSQDKGLDISGALEKVKSERDKQENELFELFGEEIRNLQSMGNADLERILSRINNLKVQLENAPYFQRKAELILCLTTMHDETLLKLEALETISNFINNYRNVTEQNFINEHNAILCDLEKISQRESIVWKIIKRRIEVRRSYEDILRNPTQFEDDEIVELLTREDSLDPSTAFENIKVEKKLQEMLQTLDFPLPENLETARNDLEDFKSFEEMIKSLPKAPHELVEKTHIKKTKIIKCIEFYELVESIERTKHIKHISRLEVELFGTTHISESIYEEKINQMEKLRQIEIAEAQARRQEKPTISTAEAQTEEMYPILQERLRTPPPILIESVTQTKEFEPMELRHSHTQTSKTQSTISGTQTITVEESKPQVLSMQTQTHETQPQVIYLTPEPTPVKLRNNQTQTVEETARPDAQIKKTSQIVVQETFQEFESRRILQNQEKIISSAMSTQTDAIAKEDIVQIVQEPPVAVLLRNTECQTEQSKKKETKKMEAIPLQNIILKEKHVILPPPIVHLEKPATAPVEESTQFHYETYKNSFDVKTPNLEQTENLKEETNDELITPKLSVRDRVNAWQINSTNGDDKFRKIENQILRERMANGLNDSSQPIHPYRLLFQSPLPESRTECSENQKLLHEKSKSTSEYEQKGPVAQYRKMFQSLQDVNSTSPQKEPTDNFKIQPKPKVSYWPPKKSTSLTPEREGTDAESSEIEDTSKYRFTESAREKTLAMYRKLMQEGNEPSSTSRETVVRNSREMYQKYESHSEVEDTSKPSGFPKFTGYKSPRFAISDESIDGVYWSSSSEKSAMAGTGLGRVQSTINKFNTLPIRPSKFVPKEFSESDYESDYECKIPPMWVPPGRPYAHGSFYRPIRPDYRSRSVPLADVNGNQKLPKISPGFNIPHHYIKPAPSMKPITRSSTSSPAFQMPSSSEEIITTTREEVCKSEMMKREESKIILAPPASLAKRNEELRIIKQAPPQYFVSVTSPPLVRPNDERTTTTTTRSYHSHKEFMEEKVESTLAPKIIEKYPNVALELPKSFPTVTTFHTQKEIMHPILYELDDQNMTSDLESERTYELSRSDRQTLETEKVFTEGYRRKEIKRFTPSKFIPITASEEEFSSAEEEFVVKQKWKPLARIVKMETPKFGPVKCPKPEKPKDPAPGIFYIACDFSLECGLVDGQNNKITK